MEIKSKRRGSPQYKEEAVEQVSDQTGLPDDVKVVGVDDPSKDKWIVRPNAAAHAKSRDDARPEPSRKEAKYIDITDSLPSKFVFYPFDHLSIRTFGVAEVQKIHRGVAERNIRHQADAISACCSQPADLLTLGDYQFLLYWERINSYKRNRVTIPVVCRGLRHNAEVANKKLPKESLHFKHEVDSTELKPKYVSHTDVNAYIDEFHKVYGLYLWPPTIADLLEASSSGEIDPELDWWYKYAGCLNPALHGRSLNERLDLLRRYIVENDTPDLISELDIWLTVCEHGVEEYVQTVCPVCGEKEANYYRIDPMSFYAG